MTHPPKLKICILWQSALLLGLLPAAGSPLRAGPALDTSSPIAFFTNTANLFLKTSGYPFTVGNIPIYPTNYYTPALHRLLQLAANMYDASTNRAFDDGSSPSGPFYPSVFRPTFNSDGTNVFINGYVEDIPNPGSRPPWAVTPLSLPDDLAKVNASTVNIYGIPWVIGARKNLPNFNEFTMQSVSQITRKVQVVRNTPWQTNVQYTVGVSNSMGVEAWNSYTNTPRFTVLYGFVNLGVVLSNENGLIYPPALIAPTNLFTWNYGALLGANPWGPYNPTQSPSLNTVSFQIPLRTNAIFLPDLVYHPTQIPQLSASTNFDSLPLTTNVILPHFILNLTNHIQFVLVDYNSERVVDYVSFSFNTNRDLTAELQGADHGGDGGVWDSTPIPPVGGNNYGMRGIVNQIQISLGNPVASQSPFGTFDWVSDTLMPSQQSAVSAFQVFMADTAKRDGAALQAPYTPTRKVSVTYSWQANDPLVHYTISDLTISPTPKTTGFTNGVPAYWKLNAPSNYALPNIGQVNYRYYPWGDQGLPSAWKIGDVYNSLAFKDPLITQSSDWNFPSGQPLSLQTIGSIHRGTPWQTVYLKSSSVNLSNWQAWTGDTLINWNGNTPQFDAALSQPFHDWALVSALAPLLNPVNPTQLFSINTTDTNAWESVFEGMTVLTNTQSGLMPLVIDTNANTAALNQIIAGINMTRSTWPGNLYTSLGQILSAPQLSVASPFLNTQDNSTIYLNDAAYESIPSQLLPLLRIDSVGSVVSSVVNSNGAPAFQFSGMDGYAYNLQASTNLQDWTTIATQQYTTNGAFLFTDPAATNFPQRYYRTVLTP